MNRISTILLVSVAVISCKEKPQIRFPYLKAGMSETAKISNAELKALDFANRAGGNRSFGLVIAEGSYPTFWADHTSVRFGENEVILDLQIDCLAKDSQKWIENSTDKERIAVIEEKLCKPYQIELAKQLECEPSLIQVYWSSSNVQVQTRLMGGETSVPQK